MGPFRYKLTAQGWLGAALLVLPLPISYLMLSPAKLSEGEALYRATLSSVTGGASMVGQYTSLMERAAFNSVAVSTLMMIGLVLLLIGRELVES